MLRFVPHYQPALWGGRRLESLFGRDLPDGKIGESWELVELPERHSALAGKPGSLGELWREGRLGGSAKGPFPFLLKWIDAADILSVQVHPDEAACGRMGKGRPKTEAWYVVGADRGASLTIGHREGLDATSLRKAALEHDFDRWLYKLDAKPGDMYLLRAGQIHAIGRGCLLLEVQQPSDTTYRLYDFGRVGADGKERQLHLDEACECVTYDKFGPGVAQHNQVRGPCFSMRLIKQSERIEATGLRVLVADHGPAEVKSATQTHYLQHGEVQVAEPADGVLTVVRGSIALVSE